MRMVTALNAISGDRYAILPEMVTHINVRITSVLDSAPQPEIRELTYPLSEVTRTLVDIVGGKCATSAKCATVRISPFHRVSPSPRPPTIAFSIPKGCATKSSKSCVTPNRTTQPASCPYLRPFSGPWNKCRCRTPCRKPCWRPGTRPSSTRRPCGRPYAQRHQRGRHPLLLGQYRTILGVKRDALADAFREVLPACSHQSHRLPHPPWRALEQCAMGMACIEMVDSVASGIIFFPATR